MTRTLGIFVCVMLLAVSNSAFGVVTYWDFSGGDLTTTSGTATMEYRDGLAGVTASGTSFATTDGSTVPHIGGQAASYMSWPATASADEGFTVTQNSGDGLTSYSIAMDILIPSTVTTSYTGLFNTNTNNTDDADLFLCRTSTSPGSLFVDRDADNAKVWSGNNVFQADTWHRVVMTYNESDATKDVCVYVDGSEVGYSSSSFGHSSLRLPTSIPFFTDNFNDTSSGYVSSLSVCDFTLNPSEVTSLGAPTVTGLSNIVDQRPTAIGSSTYADAVTASNPLVYLRFDEPSGVAVGDSVANSGTSTISTAQFGLPGYSNTQPLSGKVGPNAFDSLPGFEADNRALTFTGTTNGSDLITLDSAYDDGGETKYELDLDKATYACWIKPSTLGAGSEVFLLTTPNYNGYDFENDFLISFDYANGTVRLWTQGGEAAAGTTNAAVTTADLSGLLDDEWHMLVATRDGDDATNAMLYIDGEAMSLVASAETVREGYSHRIGAYGTSSYAYRGDMDEVAIWDRVLDASEVSGLYAAAVPEPSTIVLLITAIGSLLLWRRR